MFLRTLALPALLCLVLSSAAQATGHGYPPLAGPLAPLESIVNDHRVSQSLNPATYYTPAIAIGEIKGNSGGSPVWFEVTRYTYASGLLQYNLALSTVDRNQTRNASNTISYLLYDRRELLKAMSDEIVTDSGFFLTKARDIFHLQLDTAGKVAAVLASHFNGLGMKRLELNGSFSNQVANFETLHATTH